jgi:hypothetical protein
MIRIFIGYDPAETVAYHVLCHSIMRHSTQPVSFTPINRRNIPEFYRGKENGSTEFSFSRFLTPFLSGYVGQSIFMDCDMLVRDDISKIFDGCDMHHDVFVVKHDYQPKTARKFLNQTQYVYPKKNWSSVMVFNGFNAPCRRLTPEIVNKATGEYLHQFQWTTEERVGELPAEWNHLVGEYDPDLDAKLVHFTLGTPCFKGYEDQPFADEWFAERELMLAAA